MRKTILIVEDNLVTLEITANALKNDGYDIIKVSGIAGAEDYFPGKILYQPFDCLIIDLNMDNTYLTSSNGDAEETKRLKKKTHGGALTGWVWLYNYARSIINKNVKIIIFSAFIDELEKEMLPSNNKVTNEERAYFKSIEIVPKTEAINSNTILVDKVNEIFNRKKN